MNCVGGACLVTKKGSHFSASDLHAASVNKSTDVLQDLAMASTGQQPQPGAISGQV